ncbi:collagen-like triple helix repeat-containing protein [Streptomyces sp. URMC 129]|uniref:collagen-like triple helix repeat-containing protein n=1 Tax=Streptomyces sp. URMC 129 TaxID=3423407 RepID=UPI003F194529
MTTRRSIDDALARAALARRPHTYTEQEIEAAEARIAARVESRLADHVPRQCRMEGRAGLPGHPGQADAPGHPGHPGRARHAGRPGHPGHDAETAGRLRILCQTVVEQEGALQHLAVFLARRIPHPDGARVLGCVLQLAGREDGARFWWQYAAGAGDAAAAYCLYLHHLAHGERWEAELWHRQAEGGDADRPTHRDPDPDPERISHVDVAVGVAVDADTGGGTVPADGSNPGLVLRVLALLRGDRAYLTEAAAAVVHYVPDAVQFVDELELPLPAADFVKRIEELTATG